MNLCKDCAHFRGPSPFRSSQCARPTSIETSPVFGGPAERLWKPCYDERARTHRGILRRKLACGPSGIFWEVGGEEHGTKA